MYFFLSFTPLDSDNIAASLFRPIREGGGADWFLPRDDVHRALPPASGDGGSVPPQGEESPRRNIRLHTSRTNVQQYLPVPHVLVILVCALLSPYLERKFYIKNPNYNAQKFIIKLNDSNMKIKVVYLNYSFICQGKER